MATDWWRGARRNWPAARARDAVVVLVCALNLVAQAFSLWLRYGAALAVTAIALGVIGTAAMWWRRRYPVTVLAIAASTFLVSQVVAPVLLGLLTVAIRRRDRVLVACTVGVALCLIAPTPTTASAFDWPTVVAAVFAALVFALWGAYVGARRDLVTSLRDRADRAEAERELRADQARLAERSRIAREMHDVLAHKVSLIALQAGALEVNPGMGAERVEQSAGLIRSTARDALEELREVLGVLRADQQTGDAASGLLLPQPGLSDVPALVESSRGAGVQVALEFPADDEFSTSAIAPTTGRAVYRIVQESLTNVHKHARSAATTVAVGYTDGQVRVTVANRRPVSAGTLLPGAGAGLIGLRERIVLLGGDLTAGPSRDGGWLVTARLPAGPAPAAATAPVSPRGAAPASTQGGDRTTGGRDAAWFAS